VAGGVFLLNFFLAAKEVEQTRLVAPTRVLEDELALHPPPEKPTKRSPWDEPPPAGPHGSLPPLGELPQGESPFKST
jgi:hypothetical protein